MAHAAGKPARGSANRGTHLRSCTSSAYSPPSPACPICSDMGAKGAHESVQGAAQQRHSSGSGGGEPAAVARWLCSPPRRRCRTAAAIWASDRPSTLLPTHSKRRRPQAGRRRARAGLRACRSRWKPRSETPAAARRPPAAPLVSAMGAERDRGAPRAPGQQQNDCGWSEIATIALQGAQPTWWARGQVPAWAAPAHGRRRLWAPCLAFLPPISACMFMTRCT